MKKIAIFGTSADPPTIAHQSILQWLANNFDLVAVYASNNPFKEHFATLDQRSQMLSLLIEEINSAKYNLQLCQEISDRRSLNTINKAIEKWGFQNKFYLVIGSDLINQIASWYEIEKLLQKVTVLIMPRENFPIETEDLKLISQMGGNYEITKINLPAVSSTKYRDRAKQAALGDLASQATLSDQALLAASSDRNEENVITNSVKNYIRQNFLYLKSVRNKQ